MSKIPVPDRGQPIDVAYIYQIVEALNELSSKVSSSTYGYVSVDTVAGNQSLSSSETKIVAAEKSIYSALTTVTADSKASFSYSFNGEFQYPPIVTATPILLQGTSSGQDVSIVIDSVTNSQVSGTVNFNSAGSVALKVNIIAIGVPR
jgi:hypothetical protein